jgi:hypothetical protein
MTAGHSPLTAGEVIAKGGWHPKYARVIALASDDGYGFALVDGNGDGSELEPKPGPGVMAPGTGRPHPVRVASTGSDRQDWRPDRRERLVRLRQRPRPGHCHDPVRRQTPPVPIGEHGVWAFVAVLPNRPGRDAPGPAE